MKTSLQSELVFIVVKLKKLELDRGPPLWSRVFAQSVNPIATIDVRMKRAVVV